jgi:hypothetical protein
MDPDVLQKIAQAPELPVLKPGFITGFKIKMWQEIYPTIVASDNEGSKVCGRVWHVPEVGAGPKAGRI